ncbi:MAG: hypothetical protein GY762_20025, partial [Proteobacteria bacterium]|nr:hypothetical protein [Pseudomonadota bacterium]
MISLLLLGCETPAEEDDDDLCLGVTCTTPPENYCSDDYTLVEHATSGVCSNEGGGCCYDSSETVCDHGCDKGACLESQCSSGECCNKGFYALSTVKCRPAANACDKAEYCTGLSEDCPPDGYDPSMAAPEVCDGADNDCDGATDEDFVSETTSCGVGACVAAGSTACVGGAVVDSCQPGAASAEVCDGVDNDCDSATDEDYPSKATSCGVGGCVAAGSTACVGGAVVDSCQPGAAS